MVIEGLGFFIGRKIKSSFVKRWIGQKLDQFKIKVKGIENIIHLKNQSYILASNHLKHHDQGLLKTGISSDTFIIRRIVLSQTGKDLAIATNYLIGIPLINKIVELFAKGFIKGAGSIPVGKGKDDFYNLFLEEVEKAVNQKQPILIYPAGRQDFDFENHHEIKAGAGYISRKFNLPVVPVYINGAHNWHKKEQEVQLYFGKPFEPKEMTIDEISEKIKREILNLKKTGGH